MISPQISLSQRGRLLSLDTDDAETPEIPQGSSRIGRRLESADDQEIQEACLMFATVGIGYLFPLSALTQPVDYWKILFPDFNIEFAITTTYMYANLVFLAILVFVQTNDKTSFSRNIVGGFVGQLVVLILVPTSYFAHFPESTNKLVVLGATAAAATATAFIDSSVIGLVTQYPDRVQESFQLGVGISTLIGSLYRDITKAAFSADDTVLSSLIYFYTGAATIVVCIMAYYRLLQLDLTKKCLATASHGSNIELKGHVGEASPLVAKAVNETTKKSIDRYALLHRILSSEMVVFCLFCSTLALWPPLVTEIPSFHILPHSDWWSLSLLTIFSFMDCLGRILVRFRWGLSSANIGKVVLLRALIFPPLMVVAAKGLLCQSDLLAMLLVGFLGLTNGYFGTMAIILVNESCATEDEKAVAGTFTSFFLNSGLALGATIGLWFEQLVAA